jgi:hypothetical protein
LPLLRTHVDTDEYEPMPPYNERFHYASGSKIGPPRRVRHCRAERDVVDAIPKDGAMWSRERRTSRPQKTASCSMVSEMPVEGVGGWIYGTDHLVSVAPQSSRGKRRPLSHWISLRLPYTVARAMKPSMNAKMRSAVLMKGSSPVAASATEKTATGGRVYPTSVLVAHLAHLPPVCGPRSIASPLRCAPSGPFPLAGLR